MATEGVRRFQLSGREFAVLGLFAGLCSILALVVTLAEGWQEHAQAQWPETTARGAELLGGYVHAPVRGLLDRLPHQLFGWRLGWRREIVTEVHSRTTPAPRKVIWQYPAMQIGLMQEWVDAHPPGTPIVAHYDPANQQEGSTGDDRYAAGGPRTPNNLRLLGFFAGSSALLLAIARIMRPSSGVAAGGQ